MTPRHVPLLILGSGPAGLAAALYAARANLSPLVVRGREPGGLIATTDRVENYPGFPEGLTGDELAWRFEEHAARYGAEFVNAFVTRLDLAAQPYALHLDERRLTADALILATGASPRPLGVPGELEFFNAGVAYCATCDAPAFDGRRVVVVGGGNSALDEALFLVRYAREVMIMHRRAALRADRVLQTRALTHPRLRFVWNAQVTEIVGEEEVTAVRWRDVSSGEEHFLTTDGVFPCIGHLPNTALFAGQLALDTAGYVSTDGHTRTSLPGVFAAGDVADPVYRQAVTSAGDGARAAMQAVRLLDERFGTHETERQAEEQTEVLGAG